MDLWMIPQALGEGRPADKDKLALVDRLDGRPEETLYVECVKSPDSIG